MLWYRAGSSEDRCAKSQQPLRRRWQPIHQPLLVFVEWEDSPPVPLYLFYLFGSHSVDCVVPSISNFRSSKVSSPRFFAASRAFRSSASFRAMTVPIGALGFAPVSCAIARFGGGFFRFGFIVVAYRKQLKQRLSILFRTKSREL
jgi:hypothetical protein